MKTKVESAKQALIDAIIDEMYFVYNQLDHKKVYFKIGWIDYLPKNLKQHIFTGIYEGIGGRLVLVEHENSEASVNLTVNEITSIDKLEEILNGLKTHNQYEKAVA
jgi:hypothetical protein